MANIGVEVGGENTVSGGDRGEVVNTFVGNQPLRCERCEKP